MMKNLSLSFLFIFSSLFSEEIKSDPYMLALKRGEPSALIEGCVSAITGDFYISQTDVIVRGKEPIYLPRMYVSRKRNTRSKGWATFHYFLQS